MQPVGLNEIEMSWLDFAAILVMAGIAANIEDGISTKDEYLERDVRRAYDVAEALLSEKHKRTSEDDQK